MSIKLMSIVWESTLPAHEKFVALALADHGRDDGTRIYPAVSTIAEKVGKSERSVQRAIQSLLRKGVLEMIHGGGGRGNAAHYRMDIATLKGDTSSPLEDEDYVQTVTPMTQTVTPASPDPLEPSDQRSGSEEGSFSTLRVEPEEAGSRPRPSLDLDL